MKYRRLAIRAAMSILPLVAAAAAWVAAGPGDFVGQSWHLPLRYLGWATPASLSAGETRLWAQCLLPPLTLLLPALPVVVIGRELGRLHCEDYSAGVALLGLIVCATALGFAAAWELEWVPGTVVLRPDDLPQLVGRVVAVAGPLLTGAAFAAAGVSSVKRQRRDRRRRSAWACPGCGYNLRGNPWQCPECGRRYVPTGPPAADAPP
jgi:hypothetical protein